MHNFCIIHDDFDESYFLPNDVDDDYNDVGTDDGRGPRLAQLKRILYTIRVENLVGKLNCLR